MKAIKGNKVYTVDENTKSDYLKLGFDILNDKGKIIEYGAGKKIDYNEYAKLKKENEALKKENKELKLNAMTVEQLKAYAAENKIDLGEATTKEAILTKLGD